MRGKSWSCTGWMIGISPIFRQTFCELVAFQVPTLFFVVFNIKPITISKWVVYGIVLPTFVILSDRILLIHFKTNKSAALGAHPQWSEFEPWFLYITIFNTYVTWPEDTNSDFPKQTVSGLTDSWTIAIAIAIAYIPQYAPQSSWFIPMFRHVQILIDYEYMEICKYTM